MNVFKLIYKKYMNIRIKTKLMLTFMLLIIISMGAISVTVYVNTSKILERRVVQSTEQAFEQANAFIAYKLSNVKEVSGVLFLNRELNTILNRNTDETPLSQQIDDYHTLLSILRSVSNNHEIFSVRLYVRNEGIYAREDRTIFSMSEIMNEPWYTEMLSNNEGIYCRSTYENDYKDERDVQNIISCVRTILSDGYTGRVLGVVSIDILEESIREIMQQTKITEEGQVFLVDEQDRIVSGLYIDELGMALSSVAKPTHIVSQKQVEGTKWRLIAHIPQREIVAESRQWTRNLWIVLSIVFVLAFGLAAVIAESYTRRIRMLIQQIKHIESEQWDTKIKISGNDEVGVLQSYLNRMGDNMKDLIQEKYQTDIQKKSAELKALQAQINPHFLYNTLDLIHWLGLKYRAQEISDVAGQLAKFFRISLNDGKDLISIEEELEHIRVYLHIQNRRFGDKIQEIYHVDEAIMDEQTVKLLLQPLVENAIIHGIQEKLDKRGKISIQAFKRDGRICFVVEDDGKGMTEQQLVQMNAPGYSSGYGIRNIKERLQLYYGERASLVFEAGAEGGVKAMIEFPMNGRNQIDSLLM